MGPKKIPFNPAPSLFSLSCIICAASQNFSAIWASGSKENGPEDSSSTLLREAASCHLAYKSNVSFSKSIDIKKKKSGTMVLKWPLTRDPES